VAVGLAFLEHGPSLEEVVAALVAKGAGSIRVVPLFLGQGGHVKEDLPRLAADAARADVKIFVDKPIGEQPEIVEAIATAIAAGR
jgi:sirohydrochlorin cobaltochelatase